MVLGPLAVNVVGTLGLRETVDLSTGKAGKKLFGEGVIDRFALITLVILKSLEAGKGGATC